MRLPWTDPETVAVAVAAEQPRMCWLDGAAAAPWAGRRSWVGWSEGRSVVGGPGDERVFTVLAERLAADPDTWWAGWFGYACRAELAALAGADTIPTSCWMPMTRWLEFDHETGTVSAHGFDSPPTFRADLAAVPEPGRAERTYAWERGVYAEAFARVQHQLRLGNTYEVNLTYRESWASADQPLDVYRRLRRLNPAPYAAYVQHDGVALLSSSPERFLLLRDGVAETRPIKGSTPRGATPEEDARLRDQLLADPKLRAENLIVTDLLRNDLSTVCSAGSVHVPDLMGVETYASVHHLVTTVRGRLRPGTGTVEAVRSLLPGGSMTGAPKVRTMEVIAAVEDTPRGVYSGVLGRLSAHEADLGIVIRSFVHADGVYTAGTGGAVTVGSEVATEYAESRAKLDRLVRALGA